MLSAQDLKKSPDRHNSAGYGLKTNAVSATKFTGSMNLFGVLNSAAKPLQYNPGVNAVSFINRKSSTYSVSANGNSGSIVGMYSTNAGLSWDSTCIWANSAYFARYPQGGIWNPSGNTNINNAYLVGSGQLTNGGSWVGNWYASKQITTPGNNTPGADQQALINSTLTASQRHHFSYHSFTTIDGGRVYGMAEILNDPDGVSNATYGLRGGALVKGQFSAGAFVWSIDSFVPCLLARSDGSKHIKTEMLQAWDETGTTGYVILFGVRCNCSPTYLPIVYKTNNSGASWTLLPQNDFTDPFAFGDLWDRTWPVKTNTTIVLPSFPGNEGVDATVDQNGNLHLVTTVLGLYTMNGDSLDYTQKFGSNQYSYMHSGPFTYPTIYDIYLDPIGRWANHIVDSMFTEAATSTNPGALNNPWMLTMSSKPDLTARIQVSRSEDGKKIFYTWSESDTITAGSHWNYYPDIYARAYDITTKKITPRMNLTAGVLNAGQKAYFHYTSPKAISTGTTSFELPVTISRNNSYNGSLPVDHFYLKGAVFSAGDFSLSPYPASLFPAYSGCSVTYNKEMNDRTSPIETFPNPTSGNLTIQINTEKHGAVKLEIMDISGRKVFSEIINSMPGVNTHDIDMTNLSPGLYLVSIITDSFSATKKIVRE